MSENRPDIANLAAMAWSAYRGHKVYEATGDVRQGVRVGLASYASYYLIGGGIAWIFGSAIYAYFWPPVMLTWIVSVAAIWYGVRLAQRTTRRYRTTIQQAYTVPPSIPVPVPGEGPSLTWQQRYEQGLQHKGLPKAK